MSRKPRRRGPRIPPDDLFFFRDLCDALPKPNLADACPYLQARGWNPDPSFVSRKLGDLEDILRPRKQPTWFLIARGKGVDVVRPTPEGQAYYQEVVSWLAGLDGLTCRRMAPGAKQRQRVSVGATNVIHTYLLPPMFERSGYLERHPDTDLVFREGEFWDLLRQLHDGSVDFALGPHVRPGRHYKTEKLLDMNRVLVFPPGHPHLSLVARTKPFDLQLLSKVRLCVLPEEVQPDFPWDKIPDPLLGEGSRVVLATYAEMRIWVKYGLGVAILHDKQVLKDDKELPSIDLSDQLGFTPVHLYLPAGGEQALKSQAAIDLVKDIRSQCNGAGT